MFSVCQIYVYEEKENRERGEFERREIPGKREER